MRARIAGSFLIRLAADADRAYNQFYAMVESWGRYELVANPAEADPGLRTAVDGSERAANADKPKGASDPLPMFRLVILRSEDALCVVGADGVDRAGDSAEDA